MDMQMQPGVVGDKARLHCYMDDPLALLRGTSQQCRRMGASLLVLWSALGLGLATEKGAFGKTVEWIGCELTISKSGAALTIPESKKVRRLAGLSSWIAGLITQFKPFVAQLWAALAAEKSTALWRRQVETAVQWMSAFARGRFGPITRIVSLADRTGCGITIAADGSGDLAWTSNTRSHGPQRTCGRHGPPKMQSSLKRALDHQLRRPSSRLLPSCWQSGHG
eukprot:113164-Amphidinium_carterae.1